MKTFVLWVIFIVTFPLAWWFWVLIGLMALIEWAGSDEPKPKKK